MPETQYTPITPVIVEELKKIVGEKYVLFGDEDKLEPFSHDETPDRKYAHMPEAVIRPRTAEEIAAIVKLANREMIPITPRGAGSGLSGGAVPQHGGIVILIDRMNKIIEVDHDNMMVVVEPGVVTNELSMTLLDEGLFYPGYPMSLETCYIGGNVAENAGGGKAIKYGVTARYVLGLEMVTPMGEIVQLGGKRVKDVTGYNFVQLMVGSEGTLGIFTKIILKLMAAPTTSVDLLCLFKTPEDAIATVPKIMTHGVVPTACEFMDQQCVRASCEYLNESIPYEQAGAMLIITVEGQEVDQVEKDYDTIGEVAMESGAIEVYVADNYTTSERIWKVRRNIAEAYNAMTQYQCNDDLVVPMAEIPKLLDGVLELGKKYDVAIPVFGHAGDGNLHVRVQKNPKWSLEEWRERTPAILDELYTLTANVGGTVSGEHGIGNKRKDYLPKVMSPTVIEMHRAVKRALDPNNIMNPGKIFDL